MAQEKYGFFNSSGEDARSYDAGDMAAAFHTLASDGVASLDSCLQVTAEGSTMRTLAGYGSAMIRGYCYQLRNDGSGIQAFEHTTEASLSRIDRIVLRLNLAARTIAMVKCIGTAASTPAAPALTRDEETWELSLAQVFIRAGAQEILASDVTDERADGDFCGVIAPEALRPSVLEQMIGDTIEATLDDADLVSFAEQTLETAQKAQARANIGAQEAITASGMLKGSGAAVSAAVAGTDYALPVTEIAATLDAEDWEGAQAPYTQAVAVTGMTAAKKGVSVGLSDSATTAQYLAAAAAQLRATAQGTDSVTVTAEGGLPEIDLPILIRIVG